MLAVGVPAVGHHAVVLVAAGTRLRGALDQLQAVERPGRAALTGPDVPEGALPGVLCVGALDQPRRRRGPARPPPVGAGQLLGGAVGANAVHLVGSGQVDPGETDEEGVTDL